MSQAFLFDIEGTLIDAVHARLQCWRDALAAQGLYVPSSTLRDYIGMDADVVLRILVPGATDTQRTQVIAEQEQRFLSLKAGDLRFPSQARAVARRLKERYAVGAFAYCGAPLFEYYKDTLKVPQSFDRIVRAQNASEALTQTMAALGVEARETTVITAVPLTAKAASLLHVNCIGVAAGEHSVRELHAAGCHDVVRSLSGLSTFLDATLPQRNIA